MTVDCLMEIGLFKNARSAIARRWGHRGHFASTRDWLVSLYDTLLRYAKGSPLPWQGRTCAVTIAGDHHPVYLRLGSSDGFVLEEIFIAEVYGPVTSATDLGEMRQIVDLGANVGLSVCLWLKHFPGAKVIAVEPDPANFRACCRNLGGASDRQVLLVRACVAAKPGLVYLDRSAEECAIHVTSRPVGQPVQAMTLPAILEKCQAQPVIDLLKVDVEGAEREVFGDCAGWIDRVRNIMIELHGDYTQELLLKDLVRAGADFKVVWTGVTAGNPLLFLRRSND
jgi:FkbM family methyltransferase